MDTSLEVLELVEDSPEIIEAIVANPEAYLSSSVWILILFIFILSFVIEETAIVACAYFIATGRLNFYQGYLGLYLGIYFSDLFLYGLGVIINKNQWVRKKIDINQYEQTVHRWLGKGLSASILAARLIPGMLIPIFIMFGFSRTSLKKISIINLFVTAVYSLIALLFVLKLGISITDYFGFDILFVIIILLIIYFYRQKIIDIILLRINQFNNPVKRWTDHTHQGMPSLEVPRKITFFESLPLWIVYIPIIIYYLYSILKHRSFSYPLNTNPGLTNSGICGESKYEILSKFKNDSHFLKLTFLQASKDIDDNRLNELLINSQLEYPFIAKPDIGLMSQGIELIHDFNELKKYINNFPENEKIILQEYCDGDGEAGVYLVIDPQSREITDFHIALTYFPFIVGDGCRNLKKIILNDPRFGMFYRSYQLGFKEKYIPKYNEIIRLKITGSTSDGSIHIDYFLNNKVSKDLKDRFKSISLQMNEFWIGRYDVKFKSIEDFLNGEFKILELNGASGENLVAWDPRKSFRETYQILFRQVDNIFRIGKINNQRGFKPTSGITIIKAYAEQLSFVYKIINGLLNKKPLD